MARPRCCRAGDGHFGVCARVAAEQRSGGGAGRGGLGRTHPAGGRLAQWGGFLSSGERSRYRWWRVVAERLVGERVVLMGNAAQTIHPVGAQGFNLGLRDALTLAELNRGKRR